MSEFIERAIRMTPDPGLRFSGYIKKIFSRALMFPQAYQKR
jgi:hypothetical protein